MPRCGRNQLLKREQKPSIVFTEIIRIAISYKFVRPLIHGLMTGEYGTVGLKYALDRLGYYGGPPRAPLLLLDPSGRQAVDNSSCSS
jgi:hypothetical protein